MIAFSFLAGLVLNAVILCGRHAEYQNQISFLETQIQTITVEHDESARKIAKEMEILRNELEGEKTQHSEVEEKSVLLQKQLEDTLNQNTLLQKRWEVMENQKKERIAAEQKRIQEQEFRQKNAKLKTDLNSFVTALKTAGIDNSIIGGCSAEDDKLTIVVTNAWHFYPYRIRLQVTQNLWMLWAKIRSPNDLDQARIKLTDYNENSVGGSRWLAGSLIWVEEEN
jgi:hypothetical protein